MKPPVLVEGFFIQSRVFISHEGFGPSDDNLALRPERKGFVVKVDNSAIIAQDKPIRFRGLFWGPLTQSNRGGFRGAVNPEGPQASVPGLFDQFRRDVGPAAYEKKGP